ncbi:MAG: redoxin domain-containing protein [Herpetosiphonaceae bacterium]|nr:redoxin domain-containing protein [Herpetosiphonaceae bacterium]
MTENKPEHGLPLGSPAPDFTLLAVGGQTVSSAQFRDRQPVVVVFYRGWW